MIVKVLTKEDLLQREREFLELFEVYLETSNDDSFKSKEQIYDFVLGCTLDNESLVLVGVLDDRPFGYVVCRLEERQLTKQKECVVWQALACLNDDRTGKDTMGRIESWAREKGCDLVRANSARNRDSMEKLLVERYGFKFKMAIFEKYLKKGDE
jgi:hypothetical protein